MYVCLHPFVLVSVFVFVCMRVLGSEMCEVVDHQCQHICVSSPASYRCKCRNGFILNPDGKTCKGEGTPFISSNLFCIKNLFKKMSTLFIFAQFSYLEDVKCHHFFCSQISFTFPQTT